MERIKIDRIDIEVSRIGLGTWAIGGVGWGGTDEKAAVKAIHTALDKGINLIDTAPAYGYGKSEEIVGKAITQYGQRDNIVIATKCGLGWQDGQVYRDSSPAHIIKSVEDSLRRLNTDYIDIYQINWPDPLIAIEETAEVMAALQKQGKIRAIGVSNYSPEQMDLFRYITPVQVNQPPYNLFERNIEEVLLYCEFNHITTLLYGSLCRGLLSGRMNINTKFSGDDIRKVDPKFQAPRFAQYLAAVEALDVWCKEDFSKRVLHLALRWILDHTINSVALWGIRSESQLEPVEDVMYWHLSDRDLDVIDVIINDYITDPVGPEFLTPPSNPNLGQE